MGLELAVQASRQLRADAPDIVDAPREPVAVVALLGGAREALPLGPFDHKITGAIRRHVGRLGGAAHAASDQSVVLGRLRSLVSLPPRAPPVASLPLLQVLDRESQVLTLAQVSRGHRGGPRGAEPLAGGSVAAREQALLLRRHACARWRLSQAIAGACGTVPTVPRYRS